jgi:hypothetical protein
LLTLSHRNAAWQLVTRWSSMLWFLSLLTLSQRKEPRHLGTRRTWMLSFIPLLTLSQREEPWHLGTRWTWMLNFIPWLTLSQRKEPWHPQDSCNSSVTPAVRLWAGQPENEAQTQIFFCPPHLGQLCVLLDWHCRFLPQGKRLDPEAVHLLHLVLRLMGEAIYPLPVSSGHGA